MPLSEVAGLWPAGTAEPADRLVPVEVTVTRDGTVLDARVVEPGAPALEAAAITAARGWRFSPARHDGAPVDARIRIAVRFHGVPPAPPPAETPLEVRVRGVRPVRSASEVVRDREALAAAPHRSADELLTVVPGVFVTQHSGEGKAYQIFYRGFDAVHGQDLEIWAGGAPVNDVSNLHGQGYADLHFLPTEVVRTLSATPGSYDPRQGDFAVAGSLRLELGLDQPGFHAEAHAGAHGTRRLFLGYQPTTATAGVAPDDTFAAVELYETAGFGPARAARRAAAVAQATFPLGEAELRVLASSYSGHFASAGVLPLAEIESGRVDRFASHNPAQGGASSRSQLVAEVTRTAADSTFSLGAYLVLRNLRLAHDFTGFLTDPNGDLQQQLNDAVTAGAHGAYQLRLPLTSARDQVEAGFFARSDWVEQSQRRLASVDGRVTGTEVDARVRVSDVAGYLDLALHPVERVVVKAGVRADGIGAFAEDRGAGAGRARASQGLHVGKKGSLAVRVRPGLHAVASYGEGFRTPQARSLGEGEPTPFTRVRSYELGLRFEAGSAAASLAGFQTRLSDDLVFDHATARNERVPATRRTGVSADLRIAPHPWLAATTSATFTRALFAASDDERGAGDLVPYAPQVVARADLAFTPRFSLAGRTLDARLGAGLSLLARRPLPYGEWGDDVFLVDALAELRLGRVSLGLEIFNLLDASWFDGEFVYASRFDPARGAALVPQRHVTVGAPRTVLASAALHF